jgi:type VI secretion system protein ImpC
MTNPETERQVQETATTVETVAGPSLVQEAIQATKQTSEEVVRELLHTLTEQALEGTVTFDRNLTQTFRKAIEAIEAKLTEQLSEIMHQERFQKLEGSWRGLHYLVFGAETGDELKINVINLSRQELYKDLDQATEFDQSEIWKKIYESEYGHAGGKPYGILIGDYEITNHPEDMELLRKISGVAASSFAPFITAASPQLFGFDSFTELTTPRDLAQIFSSTEYIPWRSFRDTEESRFVTLAMPRVLARPPYGSMTKRAEGFNFEEAPLDEKGKPLPMAHKDFCWMNAAYVLGERMANAFSETGFCVRIRGKNSGGKVENLPSYIFLSEEGDLDLKCPTEVGIAERRSVELDSLGFLPLCHYKGTDYAVFFGGQTAQKPKEYPTNPDATENSKICARLPYIMASSRFAHYLKVMGRDKIGSFMEVKDLEKWLNEKWIIQYVNANADASEEMKARYPLADARVEVHPVPGSPGEYNAIAYLRPWLQLEKITASMRLVAKIPKIS